VVPRALQVVPSLVYWKTRREKTAAVPETHAIGFLVIRGLIGIGWTNALVGKRAFWNQPVAVHTLR